MRYTGRIKAWLSTSYDPSEAVKRADLLHIIAFANFDEWDGYFCLGEAEVSIPLRSHEEMLPEAIAGLRSEAARLRSEAEAKATLIETRVQQLLAITNEAKAQELA